MRKFPWWLSVILAIGAYCGIKYGIPRLTGADHRLAGLAQLLAPIFAMGLLLLAAKQLYDTDDQADPEEGEDPLQGENGDGADQEDQR